MQYDLSEVDTERMEGPDRPCAGSYHFELLNVEAEDPKSGALYADCEVLAGDQEQQEGKVHREYISNTPKSVGRILQFAIALGMTSVDELRRHKTAGTCPDIDWAKAVGRQFCGRIDDEEYQGKVRGKLNFNLWAVDSPKAKGIPLNTGKLAEFRRLVQMQDGGAADDPFGKPGDAAGSQAPPAGDAPFDGDDIFG